MIERIKSILLLFLVSLSLFLTYQLWYGQKPTHLITEDVYERVIAEKPRLLVDIITPAQIIVGTERGHYVLKEGNPDFHSLWGALSQQLQNMNQESVIDGNVSMEGFRNLLVVYFKPALPVGSDSPWLASAPYSMINQIQLSSQDSDLWLTLSDSDSDSTAKLLIPPDKKELFLQLMAELSSEERILYTVLTADRISGLTNRELEIRASVFVPEEPVYMDILILKPEIVDRDLILKTFFIDYNLARIIEEKDGGLIYTDGERGLRLTNVGLEYSYPRLEEGQATSSYPDALANSSNLISYHGGWPAGLRLEELGLIRQGRTAYYMAEWKMFYQGFPLYVNKPTRALFNDRGLTHYTRALFSVGGILTGGEEKLPVAGWASALKAAIKIFNAEQPGTESVLRLEAMELGYVLTGSAAAFRGEPVWFIKINNYKFYLKADSLDWLSEEEML